jgi:hypothetical protein
MAAPANRFQPCIVARIKLAPQFASRGYVDTFGSRKAIARAQPRVSRRQLGARQDMATWDGAEPWAAATGATDVDRLLALSGNEDARPDRPAAFQVVVGGLRLGEWIGLENARRDGSSQHSRKQVRRARQQFVAASDEPREPGAGDMKGAKSVQLKQIERRNRAGGRTERHQMSVRLKAAKRGVERVAAD